MVMPEICQYWKCQKNNTRYFDMNLQLESGDLKRVACFSKQRYKLFWKVNDSDTESVVIKRPRFQNDDILKTDYTIFHTSTIIPCTVKEKITTISEVLTEAAMHNRVNIEAVISIFSILHNIKVMERWLLFAQDLFTITKALNMCR